MSQIDGIAQIAFSVSDVARATAFYRDQLGLRFLFAPSPQMAFFDCGGVRLLVSNQGGTPGSNGTYAYFKTDNVQALHGQLLQRGVGFDQGPHVVARMPDREIWLAVFKDPDGNVLHLMSEQKPAA